MATEREMLNALRVRYGRTNHGNGPRYAIAEHVKNGAGFDANRQADMIVMDLWPGDHLGSRLSLIGHEVKCSRRDWLTELKDPTKAEAFKRYCHQWYLVVADVSIVRPGELPEGWGLIALGSAGVLRASKKAPRLMPEPLPYTMLAPLLRAANLTGQSQGRADVVPLVPASPCYHCAAMLRLRADGKWEHVETGTTTCTFPAHDYRSHYRATYKGRP